MIEVLEMWGFEYLEYDGLGCHSWIMPDASLLVLLHDKKVSVYWFYPERPLGAGQQELLGQPETKQELWQMIKDATALSWGKS